LYFDYKDMKINIKWIILDRRRYAVLYIYTIRFLKSKSQ